LIELQNAAFITTLYQKPVIMNTTKITRILYIVGVIALIAGALDPLEGSGVIAGGSAILAITTAILKDPHRRIFLWCFVAIALGVAYMFYISSKGGFGGNAGLSWWYGVPVLPYPMGWLITVILLVFRWVMKMQVNN
jgi:hypothetical protein